MIHKGHKTAGSPAMREHGRRLMREGKLGCLLLAGGEGSRLEWKGPKGTFPLTSKSLFQLLCEKIKGEIPLAIMTSPINDAATRTFFEKNRFFGLPKENVSFFVQKMLPLLDEKKKPLQEMGPDGNGGVFHRFCEKGIDDDWKRRGIEYVHSLLVDNPLADPCDPELLGVHVAQRADWTLKCVERKDREEKVGVLVEDKWKWRVVEYSDLPHRALLANTGMYCLSMDLISLLAKKKESSLPLHFVKKRRGDRWVIKQETFIFDWLPFAKKTIAILYPREEVFAPLKDQKDVESIRAALRVRSSS